MGDMADLAFQELLDNWDEYETAYHEHLAELSDEEREEEIAELDRFSIRVTGVNDRAPPRRRGRR